MARLSVPAAGQLPSRLRVDNANALVQKLVNRLSRESLISLALEWLDEDNNALCAPFLTRDPDPSDFHPPAVSINELRQIYIDMRSRKGSRRDVVDRILEGDWRRGLTLYQLAMADMRHLRERPTAQKWMAYRILPVEAPSNSSNDQDDIPAIDKDSLNIPRFHPSGFLQKLQSQVLPDMKAHFHLDRPPGLSMIIVRVFLVDSPYATGLALGSRAVNGDDNAAQIDVSRTLYAAFPDASPFVYLSRPQTVGVAGGADSKAFRNLVAEGIPKALSQPRRRYTLKYTDTTTKNLTALLATKGPGRSISAAGGWSLYTGKRKNNESPLDAILPTPPLSEEEDVASRAREKPGQKRKPSASSDEVELLFKRARLVARARFGESAMTDDGKGVERLDVRMEDPFAGPVRQSETAYGTSDDASWMPEVKLTFRGPHVFAGVRQLVENGIIDGERMPAWMTGEEGVTVGAVRRGTIRGHKGTGL